MNCGTKNEPDSLSRDAMYYVYSRMYDKLQDNILDTYRTSDKHT